MEDLKKILFNSDYDAYEITAIDFIESGTSKGTAACVTYEFESVTNIIAFAVGNLALGFESLGIVISKTKTVLLNNTTSKNHLKYKCSGSSCCSESSIGVRGGQETFL